MAQFKLDYSKAQTMQISNDAFFYLTEEEEPLDEENLDEAKEIVSMFPNGFYVNENWKLVENSDLIEVTFIPYVEDNDDYDEYQNLTNHIQLQIKWLDSNHIKAWRHNSMKCTRELLGEFVVYTNRFGNACFHTGEQNKDFIPGKESLFFMKHFCHK